MNYQERKSIDEFLQSLEDYHPGNFFAYIEGNILHILSKDNKRDYIFTRPIFSTEPLCHEITQYGPTFEDIT